MKQFQEFLQSGSGRSAVGNSLQIRISFRPTKSVADLFNSVYVNETFIDKVEKSIHINEIVVNVNMDENPSWRPKEQPAGIMQSLGQLTHLPKSNTLLKIALTAEYEENKETRLYSFGYAEYVFFA